MSTRVKSAYEASSAKITIYPYENASNGTSGVMLIANSGGVARVLVPRADLLAAVAAECDAIVIPRETLPEVKADGRVEGVSGAPTYRFSVAGHKGYGEPGDAERCRAVARAHLALAEYLDARPPIDEAQVENVYDIVQDSLHMAGITMGQVDHGVRMDIARCLVGRGVRVDVTS
jgi:hypothetical protein